MKKNEIAVVCLEGRLLDYFTALCLGWQWAKNNAKRYQDSINEYSVVGYEPRWPIGARCLIPPHKAKNLHVSEPNNCSWLLCTMDDPIAPAAFDDVPKFSMSWESLGEYLDNIGIGFTVNHNPDCPPDMKITAFHPQNSVGFQGPTYCVAAARAIVASVFGPVIADTHQQGVLS